VSGAKVKEKDATRETLKHAKTANITTERE